MEFSNSYELLVELRKKNLLKNSPKYWWPNVGSFEVVLGAILTQNSKWQKVEMALNNLKNISLEELAEFNEFELSQMIKSVGFYNQKSKRLILLAKNILEEFGSFEEFQEFVSREWLLSQKGIGFETADSILCYACFRETMVMDSYTKRLLKKNGFGFENYDEMKEWFENGVEENWHKIADFYENDLNLCYARFHGKIVEFMKKS